MEVIEINEKNKVPLDQINSDLNLKNLTSVSSTLKYDEFFSGFLIPNLPCIIQSGITSDWPCGKLWKLDEAPDLKSIQDLYGESKVPVANCHEKYFNAHLKETMRMEEFVDYWREYRNENYRCDLPLLYLKDWHYSRERPNDIIYKVPKFFASDWLNEYYLENSELNDDYMFVYMGPKGSWTPLHVDVFKSYSWSANIVGKKRWLLFPPGEEKGLCDALGNLPHDIDTSEKNLSVNHSTKSLEIIQGPGEIIFVPSGWHHQVWNLEDTISINHNWINGCNIWNVWMELKKVLSAVMKEIEDCRDMDNWLSHCQIILKASHGMDYCQFFEFLSFIIEKRLNVLRTMNPCISFDTWQLGINHTFFDLEQAKCVLVSLFKDTKEKNMCDIIFHDDRAERLIERIEMALRCKEALKI